jgi:hypothetical protein
VSQTTIQFLIVSGVFCLCALFFLAGYLYGITRNNAKLQDKVKELNAIILKYRKKEEKYLDILNKR